MQHNTIKIPLFSLCCVPIKLPRASMDRNNHQHLRPSSKFFASILPLPKVPTMSQHRGSANPLRTEAVSKIKLHATLPVNGRQKCVEKDRRWGLVGTGYRGRSRNNPPSLLSVPHTVPHHLSFSSLHLLIYFPSEREITREARQRGSCYSWSPTHLKRILRRSSRKTRFLRGAGKIKYT